MWNSLVVLIPYYTTLSFDRGKFTVGHIVCYYACRLI
jgi:hypothetical protein